ncbi:MAG: nickel pincer cofactor biosynthesis protein LarC [Acidobacteriota bacterium]
MKKVLYFDPFNGISGDMVLGALIDLGVPAGHLRSELGKLGLEEFDISSRQVERQGLFGVDVKVSQRHVDLDHGHGHEHEHGHHHGHSQARGFEQIRRLIEASDLHGWVKQTSVAIFRRLGEAEAKVHRSSLQRVHFHEVGALDSIVDIVGAAIGFHYLGVEEFYTAPLNLGHGTVTFSHGTWPVPAPATAELIRDLPAYPGSVAAEMTTPTGAAILAVLVRSGQEVPALRWTQSGFGAGDREFDQVPNLLRIMLGEADSQPTLEAEEDQVVLLEANIDDMDAELFGHFLEKALQEGALDVFYTPVTMKKSRPGVLLSLLCRPAERDRFIRLILEETTTLGVRWNPLKRRILSREVRTVQTRYGEVRVKLGRLGGQTVNLAPEFDDLRRLAEKEGVPLKSLRQRVMEDIGREPAKKREQHTKSDAQ